MKQNKANIVKRLAKLGPIPMVDVSRIGKLLRPEEMPAIDHTPLGRHRLVQALRNKYGDSFRNKPGVSSALKDFDEQSEIIKKAIKLGIG